MMRRLTLISSFLLIAVYMTFTQVFADETRPGWVFHQTPYSFKSLVGKLNAAIKKKEEG